MDVPDETLDSETPSDEEAPGLETPSSEEADQTEEPAESPSDEAAEPAADEDEPEEKRKALAKFGGDERKAWADYWRTQTRAAASAKRTAELESELAALKASPGPPEAKPEAKPPAPPPPPSPELAQLEQQFRALEETRNALTPRIEKNVKAFYEARAQAYEAAVLLKHSDPAIDPDGHAQRERELKRLQGQMETFNERHADLEQRRVELEQRLSERERVLATERARQSQAATEQAAVMEQFADEMDARISRLATEFGIPADPAIQKSFRKALMKDAMVRLAYRDQGGPVGPIDFEVTSKEEAEDFAASRGITKAKAFTQMSRDKLAASRPTPRRTTPTTPSTQRAPATSSELGEKGLMARRRLEGRSPQ